MRVVFAGKFPRRNVPNQQKFLLFPVEKKGEDYFSFLVTYWAVKGVVNEYIERCDEGKRYFLGLLPLDGVVVERGAAIYYFLRHNQPVSILFPHHFLLDRSHFTERLLFSLAFYWKVQENEFFYSFPKYFLHFPLKRKIAFFSHSFHFDVEKDIVYSAWLLYLQRILPLYGETFAEYYLREILSIKGRLDEILAPIYFGKKWGVFFTEAKKYWRGVLDG